MITTPAVKYEFAYLASSPKHMVEAFEHYGELEIKGPDDNPNIKKWAKELGEKVARAYIADEIAWCGLFVGICILRGRSAEEVVKDPLWALNWGTYGEFTAKPRYGDILVFYRYDKRGKRVGGHVGFYVAEDATHYHVLGGNTKDSVLIARIAKTRLYQARAVVYKIGKPSNVKQYFVTASGEISTNEA